MNKKYLNVPLSIWLSFLILSLIFIFFPQIDIYIASLFFDGYLFTYDSKLEQFLYHSVTPIVIFFFISSVVIFIYNYIKKRNLLNINKRTMLYIMLVLSIAPGLIVNITLKENWGRARPNQIIEFGGQKEFTPPFIISNQGGYSFSSGHSAAAFSLIGFALLATKRKRFWLFLAIFYGSIVSIARLAAGGHFLSDVITSFFIVYITTLILYGLIIKGKKE